MNAGREYDSIRALVDRLLLDPNGAQLLCALVDYLPLQALASYLVRFLQRDADGALTGEVARRLAAEMQKALDS